MKSSSAVIRMFTYLAFDKYPIFFFIMRGLHDVSRIFTHVQLASGVEVKKRGCGNVNSWFRRN